jgi:hypothetical protein
MPVAGGPFIQKTGILLEVDAADKTSYSGTGTTWINQITPGTFNGTLNNISFNSSDANGALVFTGSNTFVDFGNLGSSLTSSFSFQVAFKPAPTASGQPYTILSYASASATSSFTFKLDYTSSNQTVVLTTFAGTGSQNTVYALSASVASGSWNIVHGTFGSALAALYVNGLGQAYAPTTGSTVGYNTSNRLYAGLNFGSTVGYYTGSMANITVNNADLGGLDVNKNYNAIASRFGLVKRNPTVTDADAFAFVEAAGIDNSTQQAAINTLVLGLKSNNLWTKMHAIYPFVGGTAFSNKWNLKDPRDTDAAYRLVFSGAWTFNSLGSGGGGGALTNWAPNTASLSPATSLHASIYTTVTSSGGANPGLGSAAGFHVNSFEIFPNYGNGSGFWYNPGESIYTQTNNGTFPSNALGLFAMTRTAVSSSAGYARGGVTTNSTSTKGYNPATGNAPIFLNQTTGWTGTYRFGFATLGEALTQTDVDNLYTLIQAFNVTLGRNPN